MNESAFTDLCDLASNTSGGLHIAALAGAWLAVVAGFGGLRDHGQRLSFTPRLPSRLNRIAFGLRYRGRRLRVGIGRDSVRYEVLDGEPLTIRHYGEDVTVAAGSPESRPLPPLPQRPPPQQPPGRGPARAHG